MLVSVTLPPFQKLSDRERGELVNQVLHEGVPSHLDQPIRAWIYRALQGGGHDLIAITLEMTIDYQRAEAQGSGARFLALCSQSDDLLDIVDAILAQSGPWPSPDTLDYTGEKYRRDRVILLKDLELMLHTGSSAYRVADDQRGLMRRVDVTTTNAFESATSAAASQPNAGSATDQIREAWSELYGVTPDPTAAFSLAIKAVESAAHAAVEPKNTRATLGTMIRQLRDNPDRYQIVLPGPGGHRDIGVVRDMMNLLWTSQTSRHGAQTVRRQETQEEAEMAVHLAVLLVHWFTTGAVTRKL
jgi:hypothetical protein